MDQKRRACVFHFGDCALDSELRELRRRDHLQPVEPKVFDLLQYLIENRTRLVGKEELIERIWRGRIVSDASLSTCVKLARQAIGDSGRRQDYIRTVPRRGFRFVAEVAQNSTDSPPPGTRAVAQADPAKMAYKLPEKPSIAVLPFDNLTGDGDQDYMGDGLTENIITTLSTSPDLVVIARNSSFIYKNTPVQVQEVAERFGIRYVLEGSVQRSGDRIRVTAQLVDAIDGKHLWAERFDRTLSDLFAVQDEITNRILVEIDVKLSLGEGGRRMHEILQDHECYRLLFQGRAQFHKWSAEGHANAERLWSELSRRVPDTPLANACTAWIYWQKVRIGISDDPQHDLKTARRYAHKMVTGHPEPVFVNYGLLALLELWDRNHAGAIANADLAVRNQPTSAESNALAGLAKAASGQPLQGIALLELSMRLGPVYPAWVPMAAAFEQMEVGAFDKAKNYCEAILAEEVPDIRAHPSALRNLAAIAIWEGDPETAQSYVSRLKEIDPDMRVSAIRDVMSFRQNRDFLERFLAALREAGVPE